jgi:hypothetical protein
MTDTNGSGSVAGGSPLIVDSAYERALVGLTAAAAEPERRMAQPIADPTSHLSPDAPR